MDTFSFSMVIYTQIWDALLLGGYPRVTRRTISVLRSCLGSLGLDFIANDGVMLNPMVLHYHVGIILV